MASRLPVWKEPTYDMTKLQSQANDAIMPGINTKLTGIANQRTAANTNFNQTRDNLLQDYAKRVTGIETDTVLGKNTYSHNVNSRGVGRSSIALGGLEDIGIRGAKRVDETNTERDYKVNQAQSQLNALLQSLQQEEATVLNDKETLIRDYINQLKEQEYKKARESYEMDYNRIQAILDEEYRQEQLKLQREQLAKQRASYSNYRPYTPYSKNKKTTKKSSGDASFKLISKNLNKSANRGNSLKYAIDIGPSVRKDYGSAAQAYVRNKGRQNDLLYSIR